MYKTESLDVIADMLGSRASWINSLSDEEGLEMFVRFFILHELGHYIQEREMGKEAFNSYVIEEQVRMNMKLSEIGDYRLSIQSELYRLQGQEVYADTYAIDTLNRLYCK